MIATSALIADLCGDDRPVRPSVGDALAGAAPGSVTAASDGGRAVALVVLADRRAYVVDDRCPHDGGPLSDGFLDGDRLVCARHGWEVDPCTGACGRRRVATRPA
ncbi:MAG: Rieske 2Fe-2S domain-containing protein [Kofleriaceae bacterium]|jgi:nitrite reductase/ring-hydroxylating ferredoxin subunit|nr:Rieske 2Fe-2S domain-containing protein [Kofleriaceae bacterium]MBP9171956.1 Rieske 2Fe-2S domain-containing protein [Kofleriaceae bacterium]MBP9862312.1 Rieske 2Fe-2S domain-containing protein [Kofleriaceae bacterium]